MNWGYAVVQFVHLAALAVWVGGTVMIGFIAAPTLFKRLESRTQAGSLVGEILGRFDVVKYVLLGALLITSIVKQAVWDGESLYALVRYVGIVLMAATALYASLALAPRMASLRHALGSFDGVPVDNPHRAAFHRLHRASVGCMMGGLAGAALALFLA